MKYAVNTGQDCSTFLMIEYSGLQKLPFFFDRFAVYSDDWTKVFSSEFFNREQMDMSVYLKDSHNELCKFYHDCVANGYRSKKRRLKFHGRIGDKYDGLYFDVRHIDNNQLEKLIDLSSLDAFLQSIDDKVIPEIKSMICRNIDDMRNVYSKHTNDGIVFFRTVKHEMSDAEYSDIQLVRGRIKKLFPNSRFVVISDVESNSRHQDVIYFKFDHWFSNDKDRNNFIELMQKLKFCD